MPPHPAMYPVSCLVDCGDGKCFAYFYSVIDPVLGCAKCPFKMLFVRVVCTYFHHDVRVANEKTCAVSTQVRPTQAARRY